MMGDYDWRLADTNVWKVERMLLDHPHRPIRSSDRRVDALRARYRAFRARFPGRKPVFYRAERWTALPAEFCELISRCHTFRLVEHFIVICRHFRSRLGPLVARNRLDSGAMRDALSDASRDRSRASAW